MIDCQKLHSVSVFNSAVIFCQITKVVSNEIWSTEVSEYSGCFPYKNGILVRLERILGRIREGLYYTVC